LIDFLDILLIEIATPADLTHSNLSFSKFPPSPLILMASSSCLANTSSLKAWSTLYPYSTFYPVWTSLACFQRLLFFLANNHLGVSRSTLTENLVSFHPTASRLEHLPTKPVYMYLSSPSSTMSWLQLRKRPFSWPSITLQTHSTLWPWQPWASHRNCTWHLHTIFVIFPHFQIKDWHLSICSKMSSIATSKSSSAQSWLHTIFPSHSPSLNWSRN
jgi:hypothetical protein